MKASVTEVSIELSAAKDSDKWPHSKPKWIGFALDCQLKKNGNTLHKLQQLQGQALVEVFL